MAGIAGTIGFVLLSAVPMTPSRPFGGTAAPASHLGDADTHIHHRGEGTLTGDASVTGTHPPGGAGSHPTQPAHQSGAEDDSSLRHQPSAAGPAPLEDADERLDRHLLWHPRSDGAPPDAASGGGGDGGGAQLLGQGRCDPVWAGDGGFAVDGSGAACATADLAPRALLAARGTAGAVDSDGPLGGALPDALAESVAMLLSDRDGSHNNGEQTAARARSVAEALIRLAAFPATAGAAADAVRMALASSPTKPPAAARDAAAPARTSTAAQSLQPDSQLCLRCPERSMQSVSASDVALPGAAGLASSNLLAAAGRVADGDIAAAASSRAGREAAGGSSSCDDSSQCCETAHDCVSACLAPLRRGELQRMVAAAKMPALARARTAMDACSARCLSWSSSSIHENAFR